MTMYIDKSANSYTQCNNNSGWVVYICACAQIGYKLRSKINMEDEWCYKLLPRCSSMSAFSGFLTSKVSPLDGKYHDKTLHF